MIKSEQIRIKGYKGMDTNVQCLGFQFEVGKEYQHKGSVEICGSGFHFCEKITDVFEYYKFQNTNRFFEVEGWGKTSSDGKKTAVEFIKIIAEISWEQVLKIANTGGDNTGYSNSGNRNSGDCNSGMFNTVTPKAIIFNKQSDWTTEQFENSRAFSLMCRLDPNIWVESSMMSDEEKKQFPAHETTGGYLKRISHFEMWSVMWNSLDKYSKKEFAKLPNFNSAIFKEITGIDYNDL